MNNIMKNLYCIIHKGTVPFFISTNHNLNNLYYEEDQTNAFYCTNGVFFLL